MPDGVSLSPEGLGKYNRSLLSDLGVDEERPSADAVEKLQYVAALQRWMNAVRWMSSEGAPSHEQWKVVIKSWLLALVGTSAVSPGGRCAGFCGWKLLLRWMELRDDSERRRLAEFSLEQVRDLDDAVARESLARLERPAAR